MQLVEVVRLQFLEKLNILLQGFLGVLNHLVFGHEGAQPQFLIIFLQIVVSVEVYPAQSLPVVVLQHPHYHLFDRIGQVLI